MAYPAAAFAALILLGACVGGALFADGRMAYDAWPRSPGPDVPKRVAPMPRAAPEKPRKKEKKGQRATSGKSKHKADGR